MDNNKSLRSLDLEDDDRAWLLTLFEIWEVERDRSVVVGIRKSYDASKGRMDEMMLF